jgi:hypothetical protein
LQDTTFTNFPSLTLTFTPTQSQTFIQFSASGWGFPASASYVEFRALVNGVAVGGTNQTSGVIDGYTGYFIDNWSATFTKSVSVNPGVPNTIVIQYRCTVLQVLGIDLGTAGVEVLAVSQPAHHATLTAFVQ